VAFSSAGNAEVDVLDEGPLIADKREAVIRAGELDAAGLVVRQAQPGMRGDCRVEAPGGPRVAHPDPQVVGAAVGDAVIVVLVDRLDGVAIGIEQGRAVVPEAVRVRGPGARSPRYPR
jgi:hypothetical protein